MAPDTLVPIPEPPRGSLRAPSTDTVLVIGLPHRRRRGASESVFALEDGSHVLTIFRASTGVLEWFSIPDLKIIAKRWGDEEFGARSVSRGTTSPHPAPSVGSTNTRGTRQDAAISPRSQRSPMSDLTLTREQLEAIVERGPFDAGTFRVASATEYHYFQVSYADLASALIEANEELDRREHDYSALTAELAQAREAIGLADSWFAQVYHGPQDAESEAWRKENFPDPCGEDCEACKFEKHPAVREALDAALSAAVRA